MKFWGNVRDPSYFPAPFPDCLCLVSFRIYSPLSVAVVENRTNIKVSWPYFSSGATLTVLQEIVSAIYHLPCDKVWLSSVCWFPSATPGNDVESKIYIGWIKWRYSLKPFVEKSLRFLRRCRRPLVVVNHFTDCLCRVSFRRYKSLKLPLSCEVVQKCFEPPICRGGDTPDFGHAFSNCSYFPACGRFWLSSVQRPRRFGGQCTIMNVRRYRQVKSLTHTHIKPEPISNNC